MILKNTKLGNVEDVIIIEFGEGDILVTDIKGQDYAGVAFNNDTPHEIGTENNHWKGKTTDELQPSIVMTFTSQLSIDVVISKLLEAKNNLSSI